MERRFKKDATVHWKERIEEMREQGKTKDLTALADHFQTGRNNARYAFEKYKIPYILSNKNTGRKRIHNISMNMIGKFIYRGLV